MIDAKEPFEYGMRKEQSRNKYILNNPTVFSLLKVTLNLSSPGKTLRGKNGVRLLRLEMASFLASFEDRPLPFSLPTNQDEVESSRMSLEFRHLFL